MDNSQLGNNPFLFLSSHRKDYFNQMKNEMNEQSEGYQGYILEKVFFLDENVQLIQRQIIMSVYKSSNKKYLIREQNKEDINIVMKYIFNEYAQHLPFKIKEQVTELNNKVSSILTKEIIDNLESHQKYITDSTTQPTLLDRPQNVTSAGNRTLPSVSTTF